MHQILHQAIHFLPSHRSRNDRSSVILSLSEKQVSSTKSLREERDEAGREGFIPIDARFGDENEEMFRIRVDEA